MQVFAALGRISYRVRGRRAEKNRRTNCGDRDDLPNVCAVTRLDRPFRFARNLRSCHGRQAYTRRVCLTDPTITDAVVFFCYDERHSISCILQLHCERSLLGALSGRFAKKSIRVSDVRHAIALREAADVGWRDRPLGLTVCRAAVSPQTSFSPWPLVRKFFASTRLAREEQKRLLCASRRKVDEVNPEVEVRTNSLPRSALCTRDSRGGLRRRQQPRAFGRQCAGHIGRRDRLIGSDPATVIGRRNDPRHRWRQR